MYLFILGLSPAAIVFNILNFLVLFEFNPLVSLEAKAKPSNAELLFDGYFDGEKISLAHILYKALSIETFFEVNLIKFLLIRLKAFLYERMYRHYKVNRMTSKARRVVSDLFQLYLEEPECLPKAWNQRIDIADNASRARHVGDYIAGMTDRFALDEHRRLFDLYEENR